LFNWLAGVDIGIRPRQVFEGSDVNLFPFTKAGVEWLRHNIQHFTDPVWSQDERCLKLSPIDSTNNFSNVLRSLKSGGLKIKLYGRLKDLNESLLERDRRVPTPRPNTPRPVIVSAIIQIALLAEPMWRAIKLDSLVSIVGSSLIIVVGCFFVLQATAYRKRWARDGLALLGFLGFVWAVVSGDLFATDHLELRLAALTSIPNLIAIALLYTPTVDRWFNEGAGNKMSRPG
jgi:hypothetical protein